MKLRLNRSLVLTGTGFALAVAVAACGGGSSSSSSVPAASTPTAAPTAAPTASSSPTSAPAATWTFSGSTATLTGVAGQTPAPVSLAAYHNVSLSIQFGADTAGSGPVSVSDAVNSNDVTPATLPADNATSGFTPLIYVSFYNASTTTISFGTNTPSVNVTDSAGFGGATTCELDAYGSQGSGGTPSWFSTGGTGTVTGTSATVNSATLSGGSTVDFKPGQQLVAIACK